MHVIMPQGCSCTKRGGTGRLKERGKVDIGERDRGLEARSGYGDAGAAEEEDKNLILPDEEARW